MLTAALTFQDANAVGLGTLNIVSNGALGGDGFTQDGFQTITLFVCALN